MRIERVELIHVQVPLVEPFRISTASVAVKDAILCLVSTEGVTGVGESSPMAGAFYSSETPESCLEILRRELAPRLIGAELSGPENFTRLTADVPGNRFAKAGLEMALWDLVGRRAGRPLKALLGGEGERIPSGLAVGIYDTLPQLLQTIERYLAQGYRRVKIKIKPGWDVEPVAAVRQAFGEIPLFVDANAAYTLDEADVFRALDDYGLLMYEQPLAGEALADLAKLQEMVVTPICLDESAETLEAVEEALRLGSGRIINIKLQRVGGFGPAKAIHDLCAAQGVPVWSGYMPELGVSTAGGLHFATLPGFQGPVAYVGDLEPSLRWFVDDVTDPLIGLDPDGCIPIAEGAGLGFGLDLRKVRKYRVFQEVIA